jgi:hypothetical protein
MQRQHKELRKTVELEITKETVGTSTRLWKMSVRSLWGGVCSYEMNEETAHRVGASDIGALGTLGSFLCTYHKKDLHCLHPLVGHDVERIMVIHLN